MLPLKHELNLPEPVTWFSVLILENASCAMPAFLHVLVHLVQIMHALH